MQHLLLIPVYDVHAAPEADCPSKDGWICEGRTMALSRWIQQPSSRHERNRISKFHRFLCPGLASKKPQRIPSDTSAIGNVATRSSIVAASSRLRTKRAGNRAKVAFRAVHSRSFATGLPEPKQAAPGVKCAVLLQPKVPGSQPACIEPLGGGEHAGAYAKGAAPRRWPELDRILAHRAGRVDAVGMPTPTVHVHPARTRLPGEYTRRSR